LDKVTGSFLDELIELGDIMAYVRLDFGHF
jgi:hypothetical protein